MTGHGRDVEVTGLASDSRKVQPGYLFAALPGTETDGCRFIADAVSRGAVAILASPEVSLTGVLGADDVDGDLVTWTYVWTVDGVVVQGQTVPERLLEIKAQTAGRIELISVTEGDTVQKGDTNSM